MDNFNKLITTLVALTDCDNAKIRVKAARLLGQIARKLVGRLPMNEHLYWDGKFRGLVANDTKWH